MLFENYLSALQNGNNPKVLSEKLFETFSHQEIQPILKEIQKKLIEKNTALKRILSNNYNELLNCSDLIKGLSFFSSRIASNTQENLKSFLEFSQIQPQSLQFQQKITPINEFDHILLKLRSHQNKKRFFLSTIMLLGLKRDFLGKSNAEEVYWSYNMISDLNKENFIKIKAFVLDFIRNSPGIQAFDVKNDDYGEKNPIYQIFWSLILIYLFENEQITIKQAFLRVFETFKEFFSIIFTEKDFAIKQLILFLVIIKRILSNSSLFHATLLKISEIFSKETSFISSWSKNSFLKSKSLFANEKISNKASSKDISTCNYYIMSNLADKSDNNENNEEIQIFCKDIFEVFLNETLDKMLLRVEILLYNTNIPFSSFNFFFLKSLYQDLDLPCLYAELTSKNFLLFEKTQEIWQIFLKNRFETLELNLFAITEKFLCGFLIYLNKKKDEFSKYKEKNLWREVLECKQMVSKNLNEVINGFEEIVEKLKEVPYFIKGEQLKEEALEAVRRKIKGGLFEISEFLQGKLGEKKDYINNLKLLMMLLAFLRVFGDETIGSSCIIGCLAWKEGIWEEFLIEIERIEVKIITLFQEAIKSLIINEPNDNNQSNLTYNDQNSINNIKNESNSINNEINSINNSSIESNGNFFITGNCPFTKDLDRFLKKINHFISHLELEKSGFLFSEDFYSKIAFFLLEMNNREETKTFIKTYFPCNFRNLPLSNPPYPYICLNYRKFLKKEAQTKLLIGKTGALPRFKKVSSNINETISRLDIGVNGNLSNLLVLPLLQRDKPGKNTLNTVKMNQIQQSQTLASSVLNKEDDYISRMMEGLNNTMKGLGIKERASTIASSYSNYFKK